MSVKETQSYLLYLFWLQKWCSYGICQQGLIGPC